MNQHEKAMREKIKRENMRRILRSFVFPAPRREPLKLPKRRRK